MEAEDAVGEHAPDAHGDHTGGNDPDVEDDH